MINKRRGNKRGKKVMDVRKRQDELARYLKKKHDINTAHARFEKIAGRKVTLEYFEKM